MDRKLKIMKTGLMLALLFLPVLSFWALVQFTTPHYFVPTFYGEFNEELGDTVYHTIPDFKFISQEGVAVTNKDFEGKLYVADFIFTTCPSTCPKMSSQMQLLQTQLKDENRVLLLSHTVNPEFDTQEVLKEYAENYDVDSNKWKLVTGDKKELYSIAREAGYKLAVGKGDGGPNDFIHSQKFVLIDTKRRIRGYYDGTSIEEIERLLDEIGIILREDELASK